MSQPAMHPPANLTVGLDLGDRTSRVYEVGAAGECVAEATIATTRAGLARYFQAHAPCCVILEVGTHSPWVSRELAAFGHDVVVANPSAMYGAGHHRKRNDRLDAEYLARQGRADRRLLHPIHHRTPRTQQHLELLRARDQVVQLRSKLINHVRGAVKSLGGRLPSCSAAAFASRAAAHLPEVLQAAVTPLLELLSELTRRITAYDRAIATVIAQDYPVAQRLQQPAGVGPLTALAFVL
ncbi:MAG: IS110 family transposase [Gemmatimonadaceae bacterium]